MVDSYPYGSNSRDQQQLAIEMPMAFIRQIDLRESYVVDPVWVSEGDAGEGFYAGGESAGIDLEMRIFLVPPEDMLDCSCLTHDVLNKYVNLVIKEVVGGRYDEPTDRFTGQMERFHRFPIPPANDCAGQIGRWGSVEMTYMTTIPYEPMVDSRTGDPIEGYIQANPNFAEYSAWLEVDISGISDELMGMGAPSMPNIISETKHVVPLFPETNRVAAVMSDEQTGYYTNSVSLDPPHGPQHWHLVWISNSEATGIAATAIPHSMTNTHTHQITRGVVGSPIPAGAEPHPSDNHTHNILGTTYVDARALTSYGTGEMNSEDNEDLMCEVSVTNQRKQNVNIPEIQSKSQQTNMFSELYFSRDLVENNRFFFSIDMREILKTYSIVGKVFKRDSSYTSVLKKMTPYIRSLKLFRKRVGGTSLFKRRDSVYEGTETIFGSRLEIKDFGSALDLTTPSPEELILSTKQEPSATTLTAASNSSPDSTIPVICTLEENTNMFKGKNVSNLRHFSGIDKSIKNQYDGYYQYRIELQIHDPGFPLFQKYLGILKDCHQNFVQYLADISSSPQEVINPFPDPHLDPWGSYEDIEKNVKSNLYGHLGVEVSRLNSDEPLAVELGDKKVFKRELMSTRLPYKRFEKHEYVPGHYNIQRGEFSSAYGARESIWVNPSEPTGLGDQLAMSLKNYLQIAQIFAEAPPNNYKVNFNKFAALISAKSGNITHIQSVIQLIESLIFNIQKVLNTHSSLGPKTDDKSSSVSSVTKINFKSMTDRDPTVINASHIFSNLYNSAQPAETGFDFMMLAEEGNMGLKKVSRSKVKEIVDNEKKKIFKTPNIDLSLGGDLTNFRDTSWSFFTPTKINVTSLLTIDLSPKSDNIPCFGCEDAFNDAAKTTFFANTETGMSTNKSSFEKFATPNFGITTPSLLSGEDTLNDLSFETLSPFPDAGSLVKPLNISEKSALSSNTSIAGEMANAFKMSEFLNTNAGITIEVSSLETTPLSSPNTLTSKVSSVETNSSQLSTVGTTNLNSALNQDSLQMSARVGSNFMMNLISKINPEPGFPQISFFNLSDPSSPIKQSLDCCAERSESASDILNGAPNQIKALFKFNETGQSIATTDPFRQDISQFLSTNISGSNRDTFRYKFQTINVLECLVEFDSTKPTGCKEGKNTSTRSPQLNMPVWKKLTPEILSDTQGVNLLCKLSPYRNSSLGLVRNKSYDLPTYDEVFILKGD